MFGNGLQRRVSVTACDYGDGSIHVEYNRFDPRDAKKIHSESLVDVLGDLTSLAAQWEALQIGLNELALRGYRAERQETPTGGDRQ